MSSLNDDGAPLGPAFPVCFARIVSPARGFGPPGLEGVFALSYLPSGTKRGPLEGLWLGRAGSPLDKKRSGKTKAREAGSRVGFV